MRHLSESELLELADDGTRPAWAEQHLKSCGQCAGNMAEIISLLSVVAALKEPDIATASLGHMADNIDSRVLRIKGQQRTTRRRKRVGRSVKWVSATALPLAAALLLFLLPQRHQLSPINYSDEFSAATDDLLSPSQWDLVWDTLTDDMPELSVLHEVTGVTDNPHVQILEMTDDELRSLLNLMDDSEIG